MAEVDMPLGNESKRVDRIDPPKLTPRVGIVIKDTSVGLDGPCHKRVDAPGLRTQKRTEAIKTLADVRSFAHGDQTLGAEGHLLATGAEPQRVLRSKGHHHVQKGLMQVEAVFVRGLWAADPSMFQPNLELTKEADEWTEVEIAMEHVPLEQIVVIAMRVARLSAKARILEKLIAFALLPPMMRCYSSRV